MSSARFRMLFSLRRRRLISPYPDSPDQHTPAAPDFCSTCYVMLCYVMLCYVMLCYVMLCYVTYEPHFTRMISATIQCWHLSHTFKCVKLKATYEQRNCKDFFKSSFVRCKVMQSPAELMHYLSRIRPRPVSTWCTPEHLALRLLLLLLWLIHLNSSPRVSLNTITINSLSSSS